MADISNAKGAHFARTINNESYTQHFIHYKRKRNQKLLNFKSCNFNMYDIDFTFHELEQTLIKSHLTSPGQDEYGLRGTSPHNGLEPQFLPFKARKDPQGIARYRPIALTSCLCKTMERNGKCPVDLRTGNKKNFYQASKWIPPRSGATTICHWIIFVDDLQISCASVNMAFIERPSESSKDITKWAYNNGCIFSSQKTLCVHFCKLKEAYIPIQKFYSMDSQFQLCRNKGFRNFI
ncbi:putative RNA-directed DNA polymerase from transposon X-element [Caerostris extrusa]|uniref:RNA-directed DNA polymerase from transposon X-element n=1 Tax=Caerostris extrusa TaxID=172846 RepID=A0AAV4XBE9_CAEEX|nr:putative RNA-directed DNA polymerase from transposon X-element [Caerostris extrusa]